MLNDYDVEFAEQVRLSSTIRDFAGEKTHSSMLLCVPGRAFGMGLRRELLKQAHVFAGTVSEVPIQAGGRRPQ